jgi:transcriptional regulator with XRE-family HTH domain
MIVDTGWVERTTVIEVARRAAGLSQQELSWRSGTAQSAISDYERRRKSPTLGVVERLLAATGADVMVIPAVEFEQREAPEIGPFFVPNRLWPLLPPLCFARVRMRDPLRATTKEVWDLAVRADRIRLYELVLSHGTSIAILGSVDGALLVDAWGEIDLPGPVRAAWQPLIDRTKGRRGSPVRDVQNIPGGSSS